MSEKVHLTQLLRDVHFFDLTRLGRLSRAAFWCALLAHLFFLAVLFVVPFETAYRLQMQPDSSFVLFWMNVFFGRTIGCSSANKTFGCTTFA